MKYLILAILVSGSAFAENLSTFSSAMKIIQDPTKGANDLCVEGDQKPGEWCADLSKSVCAVQKTDTVTVDDRDADLEQRFVDGLPKNATDLQIARAYRSAIAAAETETALRTQISNGDLTNLMTEVRGSLMNLVRTSPLTETHKKSITDKLASITYINSNTYFTNQKALMMRNDPALSAASAELAAITTYTELCGNQGMEENAFYDSELNSFILCPGLIQSVNEYGRPKTDVMNGLSFTIAHEIAHAVDGLDYAGNGSNVDTEIYSKIGDCHKVENPTMSWEHQQGEIVADFWGGQVVAERLKQQGIVGADAMNNIVLAMDGLCTIEGDDEHPDGRFRIDNILGRDPQMRAQLECDAPTPQKPFCGLKGAQPPRSAK